MRFFVPALLTDEGALVTQSLSIVEYLDERYPKPRPAAGEPGGYPATAH